MLPLSLEIYDRPAKTLLPKVEPHGTQHRPAFRKLRFAKTFYGGEDQWMVFVLDRDSSKDYPDVAYGNDVILRKGLVPIFAGEIRNIEQDLETSVVKVLGNWIYLDDYSYGDEGRLWVDTRYERWETVTEEMNAVYAPKRFQMDTNHRLSFLPMSGDRYSNANYFGALYYYCPYDVVKHITFDYDFANSNLDYAPADGTAMAWRLQLWSNNGSPFAWGADNLEWEVWVNGAAPVAHTLLNAQSFIYFRFIHNDIETYQGRAAPVLDYGIITNLLLYSSTELTPTSSDVAEDIVDQIQAATPISADKSLIDTINLTLIPLAFERGETCHEALKTVAFYGDAQHKLFGWGVEGGGSRVFLRQPDYSSVRYVVHVNDAKRILLRGTTHEDFLTEGWGKYRDENGLTQYTVKYYAHVTPAGIIANITSIGEDLASNVYGVKRSAPIDFGPMDPAMAVDAIQQYLISHAHPLVTSNVEIFYPVKDLHKGGIEIHPVEMETGYLVQVPHFRAVEAEGAATVDLREWDTTFLLTGYRYDHEKGSTRLFPEEEEWDLARLSTKVKETMRELELL